MSDMSSIEDKRNDPSRRPNNLALRWADTGASGAGEGQSMHFSSGGQEDERGAAAVTPVNGGGYAFSASYYNPAQRDPRDPDAGWSNKEGHFVVKSRNRSMMAGQALLSRMQMAPGGMYNTGGY